MNNKIFREKSIERISSPEQLDECIRIANPGVWLMLSAIIIMLAAFCIWGIFGRLETKVTASGMIENGTMTADIASENADSVAVGMLVYLDDEAVGKVNRLSYSPDGTIEAEIEISNLADGKYELYIITDSIKPIDFILN